MKKIILYLIFIFGEMLSFGQNIPHPNITGPLGLQVNTYTGNLFYQRTDITLRGVGLPLYGSFYYNSALDSLDEGYGYGWNFYYNMSYSQTATTVTIKRSDSRTDEFKLENGIYKAPKGVFDQLLFNGNEFFLRTKEGTRYFFSNPSHKKLTGILDANNNSATLVYASGVLSKIRNSSGRCLMLGWSNGNLQYMLDSALPAKKYTYHYNSSKDLVSVTNPLTAAVSFTYNNHALARMADEKNNPVVINYSADEAVASITSCNEDINLSIITLPREYFTCGGCPPPEIPPGTVDPKLCYITRSSSAGPQLTTYFFNEYGNMGPVTNAGGQKAYFTYDSDNNIIKFTDWKGLATRYSYDTKGNLLTETDPLGYKTTYTYEPNYNKLTSIKDKRGQTTSLAYDPYGNLATVTMPGGITEQYQYYSNGNLQSYTNARNQTTGYVYNGDGDLVTINYPVGSQHFEYSGSCCNLSKITDANGNSLSMTYDLLNQVTSIKDDRNNTIFKNYDATGNLANETDPNGIVKNYGYDQESRLSSVFLPSAGTWNYTYDAANNLTRLKDANGHSTSYTYNNLNQLIKETDPLGRATMYTYDGNGNVATTKYPNGNTIQYRYDALNRLIQKDYPGNSDKYSYDANGNLASAFNNNITYTFEYDILNRLTKKNMVTWGKSISYTYDSAGNRKTMIDNDGLTYTYTYDGNNRLISLKNGYNLTTGFEYDLGGRLTRQNNANNTYTTYHYDNAGRLDAIQNKRNAGADISFFYYSFDSLGNRKTMQDKHGLHSYGYDSSYRLTAVQYANGDSESFEIDPTGNRKKRTKNGVVTTYNYNNADQLQNAGPINFVYDVNGNTTQQTDSIQRKYNYDGENRLVKVTLNAVKTVQWLYDPFGDKIERIDTNGVITKMIYDEDNLLAELNNSNITVSKFTTALNIDSWLSMNSGATEYFFHKDGLNSVTELTANSGQLVNEYKYDVYGNIIFQTVIVENPVLYTGRLWDVNLGLYDYRTRLYNSVFGRFITKDDFDGDNLDNNKYNYVRSNPINFIDPEGDIAFLAPILLIGSEAIFSAGEELLGQQINIWRGKRKHICWDDVIWEGITGGFFGIKYVKNGMNALVGVTGEAKGLLKDGLLKEVRRTKFINKINNRAFVRKDNISRKILKDYTKEFFKGEVPKQYFKRLGSTVYNSPCRDENFIGPQEQLPGNDLVNWIKFPIEILDSKDPNEIIGTNGYGDDKWVSYKDQLPYRIHFTNDPDSATAPAQRVAIWKIHAN